MNMQMLGQTQTIYFDSFEVENVLRGIRHKNIKTNIFRIQANKSIIWGYFRIGFIDFMFVGNTLIDFTGLFPPYDFQKNWYDFQLF